MRRPFRFIGVAVAFLSGILFSGLLGGVADASSTAVPTSVPEVISPLLEITISFGGHSARLGIGTNQMGTAVEGALTVPSGTSTYVVIQSCSMNETQCGNVASSARTQLSPLVPGYESVITGEVPPAPETTYRACAFVNINGKSGGGCTPMKLQGGSAFESSLTLSRETGTHRVSSLIHTHPINGQIETLWLVTWICDGHGNKCAALQQLRTVRSNRQASPLWDAMTPLVDTAFGHTYKACAIVTVQGLSDGACTPLMAA
jgi:hypothetical protein